VGALHELTGADGIHEAAAISTWSSPTRSKPSRQRSASSPGRRRSARPNCSATSTRCAPARRPATSSR
jgi:hypothetical protein